MKSNNSILWTGPVSSDQLSSINWITPTITITVSKGICGNVNDPKCHSPISFLALGNSLSNNYESKLNRLITVNGYNPSIFTTKCLCGFSAGYQLLENILEDESSLKELNVLLGLDTYYFNVGESPKGFYKFTQKAVDGNALMIMTTTGPNEAFLTPSVAIEKLLNDFNIKQVSLNNINYPSSLPKPITIHKKGQFIHFDYGNTIVHGQHASLIGPGLLQYMISDYIVSINKDFTLKQWLIPASLLALGVGSSVVGWILNRQKRRSFS